MDRVAEGLGHIQDSSPDDEKSAIILRSGEESLIRESESHASIPDGLYELNELDVLYDSQTRALWTYMRPSGRPSFTSAMLRDFEDWQRLIGSGFGAGKVPLDFLILGSRAPGVFCFGGDLELFQSLIRAEDREGLRRYGYRCVEILDRNIGALGLPLLTIGLVEGAALGGGFEAVLSFDFIIAERGATFGLPEIMFGLFPGMGAHAFLTRKLGSAMAERIILSNEIYTAEQMYDLGIVHVLAEPGEGRLACEEFIAKSTRRHSGLVGAKHAARLSAPVTLSEMKAIVDLWADAALELRDRDLKVMSRLASAQSKLMRAA